MVTNLHFLRIRRDFLPQSLAEEMRKRAQAATEQGADVVFMYRYSPIAEQRSLINLDIPYKYTHKQTVQLSLF